MAQNRMKQNADKNRTDRSFEVGDWVYLKLQPYRQASVALRKHLKHSTKYYGPFQILLKVGVAAYRLDLPSSSAIHPVFHVSLLKKKVSSHIPISPHLPVVGLHGQFKVQPAMILNSRVILRKK